MAEDDPERRKAVQGITLPLTDMKNDIGAIKARLRSLLTRQPALRRRPRSGSSIRSRESEFARALLAERRLRDQLLGEELFGEPVWDMLLELFIAHEERTNVSVKSLCIASAVPPTTALRWIGNLTAKELVARRPDPLDARRVWIELAPPIVEQIRRLIRLWMVEPEQNDVRAS